MGDYVNYSSLHTCYGTVQRIILVGREVWKGIKALNKGNVKVHSSQTVDKVVLGFENPKTTLLYMSHILHINKKAPLFLVG